MKSIKIKVISDVTCNNLFRNLDPITDVNLDFSFAPVDQFIPEILNSSGDDFLLVHISEYAFNSYSVSDEYLTAIRQITSCLEDFVARGKGKVILNTVCFDHISFSQGSVTKKYDLVAEFNQLIFGFVKSFPSDVILVDTARVISAVGHSDNISIRNYGVMRFPYSKLLSKKISEEYAFHLQSYFNVRKKVVFVDADNTLWGGVAGEDGVNGVKIGHEYPGLIFYHFQEMLLGLKDAGIVLCLVTKNNFSDVEEIFSIRDMPLSLVDFVEVRANWEPKSANINEMLESLNVASSSAIFIDDNQFEIEEVLRIHSDMVCLPFEIKNFGLVNNKLCQIFSLYAHILTEEDTVKAESYEQEKKRKTLLGASNTLEDYLASLEIKMTVHVNDSALAPRISQLTQKTNQFNLTTKRYSVAEIEKLMLNHTVYGFGVNDKFGSMGIVGVVIVVNDVIDSFLLSCRAFGRNIEKKMLASVVKHKSHFPICSQFTATKKNQITKNFYEDNGFDIVMTKDGATSYGLHKKKAVSGSILEDIEWV